VEPIELLAIVVRPVDVEMCPRRDTRESRRTFDTAEVLELLR
jgi:hypothetical protein